MAKGECNGCAWANRLCGPPAPGGRYDGVDCACPDIAERNDMMEEWHELGYTNLYRIEVIEAGQTCEHWEDPRNFCRAPYLAERGLAPPEGF